MTSLAIHLSHLFFHKKCYMYYDRFVVAAACLFLSCKIYDKHPEIKKLSTSFIKVMRKLDNEEEGLIEESDVVASREKICQAESDIIKVLNYDFEFDVAYKFINIFFAREDMNEPRNLYYLTRIMALDIYKTGASLHYNIETIAITAVIYANVILTGNMIPKKPDTQLEHLYQS